MHHSIYESKILPDKTAMFCKDTDTDLSPKQCLVPDKINITWDNVTSKFCC